MKEQGLSKKSKIWAKLQNKQQLKIGNFALMRRLLSELHSALSKSGSELLPLLQELEEKVLKIWLFSTELPQSQDIPEEIIALAEQRKTAKAEKNYALADELRAQITQAGWEIKDTKEGYELTVQN